MFEISRKHVGFDPEEEIITNISACFSNNSYPSFEKSCKFLSCKFSVSVGFDLKEK